MTTAITVIVVVFILLFASPALFGLARGDASIRPWHVLALLAGYVLVVGYVLMTRVQ